MGEPATSFDPMPYYTAFGWHRYQSQWGPVKFSAAHLAPPEQGDRPYRAICGAKQPPRGTRWDRGFEVIQEVRAGDRKWCKKCMTKASKESA